MEDFNLQFIASVCAFLYQDDICYAYTNDLCKVCPSLYNCGREEYLKEFIPELAIKWFKKNRIKVSHLLKTFNFPDDMRLYHKDQVKLNSFFNSLILSCGVQEEMQL